MTKTWVAPVPAKCDICQAPITAEFFDACARTMHWGNFCKACFTKHTFGRLGAGFGQHYKLTNEQWIKQ